MMQLLSFAGFLAFVGGVNAYVFIRVLQAIPRDSGIRKAVIVLFWAIAASFIAGRLLESYGPSFLSKLLIWVGSFWFAALLYFLLSVVLLDLLRLIHHFVPFFPAAVTDNYAAAKRITALGVAVMVGLLLVFGHVNSRMPRVRTMTLQVAKKAGDLDSLNIVAVSDIHLGTIVGRKRLSQIVERINSLDPDVVLLPGDIVDEDLTSIRENSVGDPLRDIRSRYGVYAATGNHEYIGGVLEAVAYLADHGLILLRDRAVLVADAFYIVGRDDRSANRFGAEQRKKLSELMEDVDTNRVVLLMDHQPFGLEEAAENGVDLQVSGHTHYGQIWPISYITRCVYEIPWGYKKKGDTHYYVSNGVGTWGPPLRIGNRPEIVNIRLEFQ